MNTTYFNEKTKKDLLGKRVSRVGDDYLELSNDLRIYINDESERDHINCMCEDIPIQSTIQREDVEKVCKTIDVFLDTPEIDDVIKQYDDWERLHKDDYNPENWTLVVENLIYQKLV